MPSIDESARTCSSVSNITGPFLLLSSIGRIWLLKWPAAIAAAARLWLSTANASCCSRVSSHFVATFSAVTPMWTVSNGSVSAPTIMSIILVSPIRAPQRCVSDAYAARLMLSTPPATAASVSPSRMYCDAETIACMPLPQRRFNGQRAGVVRQAAVHAGEPRDVHVLRLGVDDVAEHALADVLRVDLRPADGFLDDARGQVARRDVLQAAAVVTDRRAHSTQNDDFSLLAHGCVSPEREVNYPANWARPH